MWFKLFQIYLQRSTTTNIEGIQSTLMQMSNDTDIDKTKVSLSSVYYIQEERKWQN